MDRNGDGKVTKEEYINFMKTTMPAGSPAMDPNTMEMAWRAFDKNRNDILDVDEYMAMSGMNKDQGHHGGDQWKDDRRGGRDDRRGGRDGPGRSKCAMTQRERFDGSCGLCKKPYIQGNDASTCVFIGKRRFGKDEYFGRM